MILRPLRDQIVVEVEDEPSMSPGGIALLPPKEEPRQSIGMVLAVGPGKIDAKGRRQAMPVEVGERVAFSRYGHSVPPGAPTLRILNWQSVHYVLDPTDYIADALADIERMCEENRQFAAGNQWSNEVMLQAKARRQ